jgi:hypothetical protein
MNDNFPSLEQQIDRLVDGELSASESQRLLAALDAQPQAWRRCALSFLEAQAWRGELRSVVAEYHAPVITAAVTPSAVPARAFNGWLFALAIAASFLLALPLGRLILPPRLAPTTEVVRSSSPEPIQANPTLVEAAPQPLGRLRLATDEGSIEVPYYSLQDGAQYLLEDQDAMAASVIESLERAGHRVERSPMVMPVDLDNGAQVYVPVDNYRITPVSNRSIQ